MSNFNPKIGWSQFKEYFSHFTDRDSSVFNQRPDIAWTMLRLVFGIIVVLVFFSSLSIIGSLRQVIEDEPESTISFTDADLLQAREIVTNRLEQFENLLATSTRTVDPSR